MEINFVAHKKHRTEASESGPYVVESRKAYDAETGVFSYYQRVTQYLHQKGSECTVGDWYKIEKSAYNLEDGTEIQWDNHP